MRISIAVAQQQLLRWREAKKSQRERLESRPRSFPGRSSLGPAFLDLKKHPQEAKDLCSPATPLVAKDPWVAFHSPQTQLLRTGKMVCTVLPLRYTGMVSRTFWGPGGKPLRLPKNLSEELVSTIAGPRNDEAAHGATGMDPPAR